MLITANIYANYCQIIISKNKKYPMHFQIENEETEYKRTTAELNDAIIDIVAMLNKNSKGVLYFGVKNNGDICGMDVNDTTLRNISAKIYEQIKPQIYPTINAEKIENKTIIKIEFTGVEKPYSANGKYYIRVADESRELNPIELSKMILNLNYQDWERQITDETTNDIDEEMLKNFYDKAITSNRIENTTYNKENLLLKLKLLANDNFHLNNAGKLLFSKNKPLTVKMAIFATNEKTTFIDMKVFEGNIFNALDRVEKYIKENIKWKIEINGFERTETPEIPIEALREIIVNSFAHASYVSTSRHEIDIYPNRLAIYNPGCFPNNLKPTDFVNKDLASKIRNELICDVLYKCKKIEAWGTGFKKTYTTCQNENIKISYENEQDGFWFIFYRNNINYNNTKTSNIIPIDNNMHETNVFNNDELSESELNILNEINKNSKVTIKRLSELTKKGERTIQRILNKLKDKNIIKRIDGKKGYWKVLTNCNQ